MDCEVVVVGGGIGGLTTAALLAARGVKVCLFEKQSRPGGCVANFEHLGYEFEPTAGLYSGWESEGVYEQIFSEIPGDAPNVRRLSPPYVVRLPDETEVAITEESEQFDQDLRVAFPECYDAAIAFYSGLANVAHTWNDLQNRDTAPRKPELAAWINSTAGEHLFETSLRFRRFIDVQLQTFTQCASDECSYLSAALALTARQRGLWAISGGAQALADVLAESLKQSGGSLRLNATVLRLAYGSDGSPIGVDLLSGERIKATRAIVSNLTIWDTYGKLIGLSRTPASISARLRQLRAWGAYLLFLGMDQSASARLKADRILVLTDWQQGGAYAPDEAQFMFSAAPSWDARAPAGNRAVTVSTFTRAEDWFTFHESEEAHEAQDQAALEIWWARLHSALPQLGDGLEVIETATPRTFYETTRRKLGMVGGVCRGGLDSSEVRQLGSTIFPNVFMVSDTACFGSGVEAVSRSALALANAIVPGTSLRKASD